MKDGGELPVNLIFLFEGEEEIGSPNLRPFLEKHRDELKCDVVAISDTGMVAQGVGTFTYGIRGIACMEVKVKGPSIDLHSGIFGGAVANPNTMVARLAATLHDDDGKVAIDGFYDDVRPLEQWERTAWNALGDSAQYTSAGGRTLPYVMPIMNAAKALAATLSGEPTALVFPLMPVAVKTPALPVVVASPAPGTPGEWHEAEPGLWQRYIGV